MDEWQNELAREAEDAFYADLVRFLRREPNAIRPGTICEAKALLARALVDDEPALLDPVNKQRLLARLEESYRDEAVTIIPTDGDLALGELIGSLRHCALDADGRAGSAVAARGEFERLSQQFSKQAPHAAVPLGSRSDFQVPPLPFGEPGEDAT